MPSADDSTTKLDPSRVESPLTSTRGEGPGDKYEYGTISGVHNAGTYFPFTKSFSGNPVVDLTGINTGSAEMQVQGTPAPGSFEAKVDRAGSFDAMYQAMGGR